MWRVVLGCLVGMLTSILAVGLIYGGFAYFRIGPIGRFISEVIAKGSFDDYSLVITHQGLVFGWLVISPLSSLIGGLVGTVVSSTRGAWVGLIAALPMVFMVLSGKSDGALRVLSVLLCLAIGGGTGYTVERLLWRKQKTVGD